MNLKLLEKTLKLRETALERIRSSLKCSRMTSRQDKRPLKTSGMTTSRIIRNLSISSWMTREMLAFISSKDIQVARPSTQSIHRNLIKEKKIYHLMLNQEDRLLNPGCSLIRNTSQGSIMTST